MTGYFQEMDPISLKRDEGLNAPAMAGEDGLFLHISNPCVVDLPESGLITFRYRRGDLHLVKGEEVRAFTDLNLTEIVDVESCEDESEDDEKAEDNLDKLFAEAAKAEPSEEDEDGEDAD